MATVVEDGNEDAEHGTNTENKPKRDRRILPLAHLTDRDLWDGQKG